MNISQSAPTVTPWDIVYRPVAPGSSQTWAQYLHDLQPPAGSPFAPLADLRASMTNLATLPTAELDRLLTETLDACSHRLDVWMSAVAYAVLTSQRASAPAKGQASLHLGAYGWLENVRPGHHAARGHRRRRGGGGPAGREPPQAHAGIHVGAAPAGPAAAPRQRRVHPCTVHDAGGGGGDRCAAGS